MVSVGVRPARRAVVDFMGEGWSVVALIFGISMIASTADTLQSGMTALLYPAAKVLFPCASDRWRLTIIIVVMALLNVPCILLALSGQSILQLFLLADLLAATARPPPHARPKLANNKM